jgi:TPR repeat protein
MSKRAFIKFILIFYSVFLYSNNSDQDFLNAAKAYEAKEYKRAFELFKRSCDEGDFGGCYVMGEIYDSREKTPEIGEEKNDTRALKYYTFSCKAGFPAACYKVGLFYKDGRGAKQSYSQAKRYYKKACTLGERAGATACVALGTLYEDGKGGEKNSTRADQLYLRACNLGNATGCYNYAVSLSKHSNGDTAKGKKALSFFKKACSKGDSDSCLGVGMMYEAGYTAPKDYKEAFNFYQKACKLKNAKGCFYLGVLYGKGKGVKKDYDKAEKYLLESCYFGFEKGCKLSVKLSLYGDDNRSVNVSTG